MAAGKKTRRKPVVTPAPPVAVAPGRVAQIWFGLLFTGIIALVVLMAWDFMTPILFGLIIAGSFYPLHQRLQRRWQLSDRLAALLTATIILLVVLLPMVYMIVRLAQEATLATQSIITWLNDENLKAALQDDGYVIQLLQNIFAFFNQPFSMDSISGIAIDGAKAISQYAIKSVSDILSNTFQFIFHFVLMMIVIYSILQDGPALKEFIFRLSPMPHADEQLIVDRFNQMNFVTIVCNGLGGLIQGVLAGLLFWLLGIPSSLLWTVAMIVLAFIPLVGISFVYIPATLYLVVQGQYWQAALLFVYCSLVAFFTENWFKPIFMGNRVKINSMLVFFSIIGGMSVFGMAGIFYGPLIIIIFLTFVELYHAKYAREWQV
ncbi:MAG: AI-2E family transporter [Leptospiraceae bacterium]|nr:AI-2E family transporter [Leptospiraceae bacterium]